MAELADDQVKKVIAAVAYLCQAGESGGVISRVDGQALSLRYSNGDFQGQYHGFNLRGRYETRFMLQVGSEQIEFSISMGKVDWARYSGSGQDYRSIRVESQHVTVDGKRMAIS